jgi:ATP-dependent Clp protease ATP-binding subunit ClpB
MRLRKRTRMCSISSCRYWKMGDLTDNKGRVANFKNAVVIMTSNIGSDLIRAKFEGMTDETKDEVIESTQAAVFELLKQSVRPEFLNRIDEIVMFRPLSRADIYKIAEIQLDQVKEVLKKQEIELDVAPEAMSYLAEEGFNPEFGARPLKRVIQKKVLNELSKQMLLKKVNPKDHVVLDVFDGKVVFRQPRPAEIETN